MRAVIQRVSQGSVTIAGEVKGEIGQGLVILLGIEDADNQDDINWLAHKIVQMRIFSDEEGKMNKSLIDVDGEILLISQFTLHASTKKGNRPSFIQAAKPERAIPIYQAMIKELNLIQTKPVQTGEFGADMQVSLINDGPVTIIIDSQNRE